VYEDELFSRKLLEVLLWLHVK